MNMKKTFAGAMAGALAVSAMATSASAVVVGEGSYPVSLLQSGDAYATVKFTFDGDYMLTAANGLTLDISDADGIFVKEYDGVTGRNRTKVTELTAEFVGSAGTTTQTLKYSSDWNSVDYYSGDMFTDDFFIPLNSVADAGWGQKAGLYTDKYKTVKEALAVNTADGEKRFPQAIDATGTAVNTDLGRVYFDKIVVTAKIPLVNPWDLANLNARWGQKDKVKATITGITDIEILNLDNAEMLAARAELTTALKAKLLIADYEAAKVLFESAVVNYNKVAGTDYTIDNIDTDALGASGGLTTAEEAALEVVVAAEKKYEDERAAAIKALIADDDIFALGIVAPEMVDAVVAQKESVVETLKATGAANTNVGVIVANDTAAAKITAETLFTKSEKSDVGVKSGVYVDGAKFDAQGHHIAGTGTIKTVTADIGAWKPDALRQIRDYIGTNTGVSLVFEAKDAFGDATYRDWINAVGGANQNWTATNGVWGTDNDKDAYEVWGESMFTGAIVLNRDFSKQFSASNIVDWGTKTLTIDWDTLTEGRFTDAALDVHSLEILSTQNVEWVSCTVVVPAQDTDVEPVDPSQGAEDPSSEINDTPVTEVSDIITAAPETDAPAPATEAPAPAPAPNPTTGNAPVALAVIPVALAAAAIVAKKRG